MSVEEHQHIVIEGMPLVHGRLGIRKEFSEWSTDHPERSIQVSLFIRALQLFYDRPYTESLSYFQVAGIHGYPGDLPWDHSEDPMHTRRGWTHKVYCTHNLITFPTWHRPYMALFEQTLGQLMGEVIDSLPFFRDDDKKAWIDAAAEWRLPYWDWALPVYTQRVPSLFRDYTVRIRTPAAADGSPRDPALVPNPLARYQLRVDGQLTRMGNLPGQYKVDDVNPPGPIDPRQTLPWSQCSGTSRYGITSSQPSEAECEGVNDAEKIANALMEHQYYGPDGATMISKLTVSDLVYRLLSNVHDWASFATTATNLNTDPPNANWESWISLEYIHNNLHAFIGGGDGFSEGRGHMSSVPVAAFDPIFYMHHCNIDRLLALWQALHDDSWFVPEDSPPASDHLTPFHCTPAEYFTSDTTRNWRLLGYTYEILEPRDGENQDAYIARLKKYVDETYKDTSTVMLGDPRELFEQPQQSAISHLGGSEDSAAAPHTYDDYIINVQYDRYGFGGGRPYTIHFFLGTHKMDQPAAAKALVSEIREVGGISQFQAMTQSSADSTFPRHVGSIYTFSSPYGGGDSSKGGDSPKGDSPPRCANCKKQHDDGVLSRAAVPLTVALYHDAAHQGTRQIGLVLPGSAEEYLTERLSWVAVTMEGEVIPWEQLPKTKVFVLRGKAEHYPETGRLSVYRDYVPMPEVTRGRPAGASRADYGLQDE